MHDPVMPFDRSLYRLRRVRALAKAEPCDFLPRLAVNDMLERLADVTRRFDSALVIGQAPGLPSAIAGRITTMDMAAADVVADEEFLPFAAETFDLVIAPLTLHWVNDLPGTLLQIRRMLRPDGFFLATMLGGETLWELRQVLLQAESETGPGVSPRVSPFADLRDMGSLMQRAEFALPVVDGAKVTATYNDLFALIRDLRAMGATNAPNGDGHPLSRRTLFHAAELYATRFGEGRSGENGRIPATFHFIHLAGWSPHASQQKPLRPGSAKTRLAEALGTTEIPLKG